MTKNKYHIKVDEISEKEWYRYMTQFSDSSFYQTYAYGKIRWGKQNLSHMILKDSNNILSMAQVRIIKIPYIKYGIAYISWGPIWKYKESSVDTTVLYSMLESIVEEYAIRRKLIVRIRPNIIIENEPEVLNILGELGFRRQNKLNQYQSLLLDLSLPLDEIRKNLNQKWRNRLNRSEKNILTIVKGNSNDVFSDFKLIYNEMMERKNFKTSVNVNEFSMIQQVLPEPFKMYTLLCYQDNQAVSGAVFSHIGDVGIYLLGGTANIGLKAQGSYLIQWKIIEWLKQLGCKWYDLGGIDIKNNPNGYHFKSGITKNEIHHIGQYELSKNRISYIISRLSSLFI